MIATVTDSQFVGETLSTLFSVIQQGPASLMVTMKNSGVNTLNYDFQEFNGTSWADLGAPGSLLNNTLMANQVIQLIVTSTYPQVQLVGNASGGALLEFTVVRYYNRASGGALPLIAV